MKCCILPPRTLYHPVLPFRSNNKLLFCLCKTCAIEQNTDVCTHETIVDRALLGSWVIDEIRLSVEKGYRLIVCSRFMNMRTHNSIRHEVGADYLLSI